MIPKTPRVTIKDVARDAGVSIASVSFALNGSGSVGADARARILEAAARLGYRRNQSAQAMRTGRSKTLGLLLPDLCNPFFPELAHAVGNAARLAGYAMMLVESHDGKYEREGIEQLSMHGVDGICWCPSSKRDLIAEMNIDLPVVVLDRPLPHRDVIISDYALGGELLAAHLIDRGYANVALVNGPRWLPGTAQRRDGLTQALGGRIPIAWQAENPFSMALQPDVMAALQRRETRAIVCANDTIAIGVLRALDELGLRTPEDVAVLGFDDIPWSAIVKPALTTVRQRVSALGAQAVAALLDRIEKPRSPVRHIQVGVDLVCRGSS